MNSLWFSVIKYKWEWRCLKICIKNTSWGCAYVKLFWFFNTNNLGQMYNLFTFLWVRGDCWRCLTILSAPAFVETHIPSLCGNLVYIVGRGRDTEWTTVACDCTSVLCDFSSVLCDCTSVQCDFISVLCTMWLY